MKIFKISFKNINNLKGENSISFDEEPLSSAGIFAITGPTGSGKSTILDVITLALFNKIPRFKGSISKNAIEGMGSVITHHTTDAYARIEYEIKGERYTSEWITKNTKAGKLVDYEMFIYDPTGKPFDLKKSEVPAYNEGIIGLKYDQFVKSIILSQGQFAKFLKASKDERGQLLENLTGSSIYRKIGIATFDKHREIKNAVMMEKDRLENISCLAEDARKELKNEILEAEKQKVGAEKILVKLNQQQSVKSEIRKHTAEIEIFSTEQKKVKLEEGVFESQKNKLEIYDKLSPLRSEMTRYQDASKSSINLRTQIAMINQQLSTAREEYNLTISEMSNLTKKAVTADNFSAVMSAFEKEVNTLDQDLKHIISRGSEARSRIVSKASKAKINLGDKPSSTSSVPILNQRKSASLVLLSEASLSPTSNANEIRVKVKTDSENLLALKEIRNAWLHEAEVKQKLAVCQTKEVEYQVIINRLTPLLKTTTDLEETTKEKIDLLKKQREDQLLIASLTDHRSMLIDGEPCPLCGAEHHPWADYSPVQKSDIDDKIKAASQELKSIQNDLQLQTKQLTTNQASAKLNASRKDELDQDVAQISASILKMTEEYLGEESIDQNDCENSIRTLTSRIDKLSRAVGAIEELEVIDELLQDFKELDKISADYKIKDAERKSLYVGKNISEECNRLQNKNGNAKTRIATSNSRLEIGEKSLLEAHEVIVTNKAKLDPIISTLGFADIQTASAQLISEAELSALKVKKEQIQKAKIETATKLQTLQTQLEQVIKADSEKDVALETIVVQINEYERLRDQTIKSGAEKSAILKKDDEDQVRLKNKAGELDKLNHKLEKWDLLNKMIGDRNGNKFANFAQGLTLQNLLVFANRRLKNLSDRYLLNKPVDDGPLTVLDQYQGNIQRSVTTLSGGESFLISLALALSLSDMASKNVKLESLFIDEGFGTLDQETLEIAMNTLEKLQTESQKTVGVISHVETLKERINVQIKLQKDAMGYSSILVES
ncbi:MAG: exonuclease SbcC [Saprospiraceae bacterium]|jgi:exonuclease SbcC